MGAEPGYSSKRKQVLFDVLSKQTCKGLLAAFNIKQEKTLHLTPRFKLEIALSNFRCSQAHKQDGLKEMSPQSLKNLFIDIF